MLNEENVWSLNNECFNQEEDEEKNQRHKISSLFIPLEESGVKPPSPDSPSHHGILFNPGNSLGNFHYDRHKLCQLRRPKCRVLSPIPRGRRCPEKRQFLPYSRHMNRRRECGKYWPYFVIPPFCILLEVVFILLCINMLGRCYYPAIYFIISASISTVIVLFEAIKPHLWRFRKKKPCDNTLTDPAQKSSDQPKNCCLRSTNYFMITLLLFLYGGLIYYLIFGLYITGFETQRLDERISNSTNLKKSKDSSLPNDGPHCAIMDLNVIMAFMVIHFVLLLFRFVAFCSINVSKCRRMIKERKIEEKEANGSLQLNVTNKCQPNTPQRRGNRRLGRRRTFVRENNIKVYLDEYNSLTH